MKILPESVSIPLHAKKKKQKKAEFIEKAKESRKKTDEENFFWYRNQTSRDFLLISVS